jgi:preprotein translocase subunit SecD
MSRSFWRPVLFLLIGVWILSFIVSVFAPKHISLPSWLPRRQVVLGLDLRGGVHLSLEVGVKELEKERYAQVTKWMRPRLREGKILYKNLRSGPEGVTFSLLPGHNVDDVQKILSQTYGDAFSATAKGTFITVRLSDTEKSQLTKKALDKSVEIIRRRVDDTGALEPVIQTQGDRRIILQIPGFDDPQRVKDLLGKTAKLTFQWLTQDTQVPSSPSAKPSMDVLDKEVLLTGDDIEDARAQYVQDSWGKDIPSVSLTFTSGGAHSFSELTRHNIGRRLAIVLDKTILSAPSIESHIQGGNASITGMKSLEESQNLALMIRSGALPAPLHILEEKVVGPGLGEDSIRAGTWATGIAVGAVAIWMILIYSFFGIFAVAGIGANLCLLMMALILMGATLTLPGIAGIALTIGMSVDANVLINERIKEELLRNQNMVQAIEQGYKKARKSILDSNITTLTGALLLYWMGTGPVRGFAVTMALGIVISLFTSMSLTKNLVLRWIRWKNPSKIWI